MIADASIAVMPVLVGPLQILLALLPAILAAVGGGILAAFKPSGFKRIVRFFWHQKLFTACLIAVGVALWHGYPQKLWSGSRTGDVSDAARAGAWPLFRGGTDRTGYSGGAEPTAPASVWEWTSHETVYSSPTVVGGRVYFTTVTGMGPFTPEGKGAVVCVDAESGKELWLYAPDGFRGTFSSVAVGEERVVVGEGLHPTSDARVTCLDLSGRKVWEFRTQSHVEATPCIHNGRVYVAAAGDGLYCFHLAPATGENPQVAWHLPGDKYIDCESSPVTDGKTVWFGLGDGGNAVVAVDAATGEEKWRTPTPRPVFAPPTLVDGKLYIATGNGNFMQSAEDLRAARLESLKEDGATAAQLEAAAKELAPLGELWRLDAATGKVEWRTPTGEVILGAIAHRDGRLTAGSRSGELLRLTTEGEIIARWNAGSPLLASPAVGPAHTYAATKDGRLIALKSETLQPLWDTTLQREGTLTSSPAIAHGRIYIGTEGKGLQCVGTTEPPEPEIWLNGSRSTESEFRSIPESPTRIENFPEREPTSPKDWRWFRLAPIQVDADSLVFSGIESTEEGQKIGRDGFRASLGRLNLKPDAEKSDRLEWKIPLDSREEPLSIAMGNRVVLAIERDAAQSVECFDSRRGERLWTAETMLTSKSGLTANASLAFGWQDDDTLLAMDLKNGQVRWKTQPLAPESPELVRHRSPSVRDDLLLVAERLRERAAGTNAPVAAIVALDAPTGKTLWRTTSSLWWRSSPVFHEDRFLITTPLGLEFRSLADGRLERQISLPGAGWVKVCGDKVIVHVNHDFVILDSREGTQLARVVIRHGENSPILMGRSALLYCGESQIRRFDLGTQEDRLWMGDIPRPPSAFVTHGDRVCFPRDVVAGKHFKCWTCIEADAP